MTPEEYMQIAIEEAKKGSGFTSTTNTENFMQREMPF